MFSLKLLHGITCYRVWKECTHTHTPTATFEHSAQTRMLLLSTNRLWSCLGPRWRWLNAVSGNNPAKRFASDARLGNARNEKSETLYCAREKRRNGVRAAFAYKRRAAGARGAKQGLSPCTKNSATETKSLWTNRNYVQQQLLPQLPDNTRMFFYIVKRVNGVTSLYTCCWQKPSGNAEERQQHITNSSSNGNSSGTPFF